VQRGGCRPVTTPACRLVEPGGHDKMISNPASANAFPSRPTWLFPLHSRPADATSSLDFSESHPPDSIPTNRIRRIRRCTKSVITYKLILHLIMLKKSAIKKKIRI
jgi:hypothetical protein